MQVNTLKYKSAITCQVSIGSWENGGHKKTPEITLKSQRTHATTTTTTIYIPMHEMNANTEHQTLNENTKGKEKLKYENKHGNNTCDTKTENNTV